MKLKISVRALALAILAAGAALILGFGVLSQAADSTSKPSELGNPMVKGASIELSDSQAQQVVVATVTDRPFQGREEAVGTLAFDDEKTVPVFPAYTGKITAVAVDVGRDVRRGDPLYTIDSPDLLQAESALISASGTLEVATHTLERAQTLYKVQGVSQKELQQDEADHQTAEAAYRAAREGVRIYGKEPGQIDELLKNRRLDATLIVRSPFNGRVVARNGAAPGVLVQPGTLPAPFSVADISHLWMLANVPESQLPSLHLGQTLRATILAYPGQSFEGRIDNIGASVDPNTHRVTVRAVIQDPQHRLRAGMLANFVIETGSLGRFPAVPLNGLVREGDGTLTVWVTRDGRHFDQRVVSAGVQADGYYQIVRGLTAGERIATDGAVFLSHAVEMGNS